MALPKIWGLNERLTSANLNAQFAYCDSLVPIGTILPFYDFGATVSFDTNIFTYCNGATISDGASALNGLTLPDLSNRYLVGFGTEAGGDIGSAAWATTVKGNASHQVDLQHAHAETVHAHTLNSHTHSVGAHLHNLGNAGYVKMTIDEASDFNFVQPVATASWSSWKRTSSSSYSPSSPTFSTGFPLGGTTNNSTAFNTGSPSTANTGNSSAVNTGNGGSTAQSIQPRSVQVRYIMRYK